MKYKQISISLQISEECLGEIYEAQNVLKKKLGIQYQLNNQSTPHINIFSGKVIDYNYFLKKIKTINFPKRILLKSTGLGLFFTKKPLLYIRYENKKKFSSLRLKLKNSNLWHSTDKFVKNKNWIPKTTIAYNDFIYQNISDISDILSSFKFENSFYSNTFTIIEYNKNVKEKELLSFSI